MEYNNDSKSGWVNGCSHRRTTHYDERPPGMAISLLVVHCISLPPGVYGSKDIEAFFMGTLDHNIHPYYQALAEVRVSAHYLIRRDGALVQFVSNYHRAWHAGVSSFQGIENCNNYSIGVELEGEDSTPFEAEQYKTLVDLTRCIRAGFPDITLDRIVGHSDIAPKRKTDPGKSFDWPMFKKKLINGVN